MNKPTLDALNGVAYTDVHSPHPDVVPIMIYSDSRLAELGGEQEVQRRRYEAWQRGLEQPRARIDEAWDEYCIE